MEQAQRLEALEAQVAEAGKPRRAALDHKVATVKPAAQIPALGRQEAAAEALGDQDK